MGRRTILLLTAVIVAALGASLVYFYVKGADDRLLAKQDPKSVLVAVKPIAAGTKVSDAAAANSFQLETLPGTAVVAGALSDITPVKDLVALGPIFPGEQILAAKFGGQAQISALPVPKGRIGLAVTLGDPQRVAGFVTPGSKVVVFLTTAAGGGQPGTQVLLPEVQVLATGPTTISATTTTDTKSGQQNTEQVPKAILTLNLDENQAKKLIQGQSLGQLYMGLLGDGTQATTGSPATAQNLFS